VIWFACIGVLVLTVSVFIVVSLWEMFDNEEGIDD
jgi:hypothetical protein